MCKLTGLESAGSAIGCASDGLLGLLESRLLGVGGDLLLGLLAEALASVDVLVERLLSVKRYRRCSPNVRHVDCEFGGFWLEKCLWLLC